MSGNLFNDTGFDLIEKIAPPSPPIPETPEVKIIQPHPPVVISNQPKLNTGNKIVYTGLIIAGVLCAGYLWYKVWKLNKQKDSKKKFK